MCWCPWRPWERPITVWPIMAGLAVPSRPDQREYYSRLLSQLQLLWQHNQGWISMCDMSSLPACARMLKVP